MKIAMPSCRRHPKAPAGWHCQGCAADLCPDCVAKQPGGAKGRQIAICCACGRGVTQLTIHRRSAQPFSQVLARAFGFPLGSTGIISMAFVGFVRALSSYGSSAMGGAAGFAVRQGLYWALIFFTIRGVASGQRRMGVFDFSDIHSDLVAPAFKGILSTAILWIPAAIYIYVAADAGLAGLLTYPAHRDAAVWLLALIGALYAPMALLAAATDLGYGFLLNPIFIFQTIARIGRNYLTTVLAIAAVLVIGGGLAALVGLTVARLPVPFVGRWLTSTVGLYPAFVAAGMLGALLYVHGEVLDWGRSEEYQIPLLPGVEPRGKPRPRWDERPQQPQVPSAIDLPAAHRRDKPELSPIASSRDPQSMLNLSAPRVEPQPAAIDLPAVSPAVSQLAPPPSSEDDRPPSMLKFGIKLPSEILRADALLSPALEVEPVDLPAGPATIDLPPAEVSAPVSPSAISLAAASAPPGAFVQATARQAPRTAFVEPRPGPINLASAPTVHGFATGLLPQSEAAATVIGHEAVDPTTPQKPRG